MKDIKHIRRDFHSVAWVMPQGLDFGGTGGLGGWSKIILFRNSTEFGVRVTHMNGTIFWSPPPHLGGAKRSNIIKIQLLSQFQLFSNQILCVFSQMKDYKHFSRDVHSVTWVMPQGRLKFSEHGHVAYQIKGDDQETRIQ